MRVGVDRGFGSGVVCGLMFSGTRLANKQGKGGNQGRMVEHRVFRPHESQTGVGGEWCGAGTAQKRIQKSL